MIIQRFMIPHRIPFYALLVLPSSWTHTKVDRMGLGAHRLGNQVLTPGDSTARPQYSVGWQL